jgi:hypothetical protein
MNRVIWQYWETKGEKPAFVDGLFEIAKKNAGVPIIQVTPETLPSYLPDLPPQIHEIQELAHKADMLRALLVQQHGGMWLDSDALVLKDLNWLFDLLDEVEFVGFNDSVKPKRGDQVVRVNCFLSRPGGWVVSEWVRLQHAKFPRTTYRWTEVGSDILHPLCLDKPERAKILPFEMICPIPAYKVSKFSSRWVSAPRITEMLDYCVIVMLSNKALSYRNPEIQRQTTEEIARDDTLIGHFVRRALDARYAPPTIRARLLRRMANLT